jgi:putative membrane protein
MLLKTSVMKTMMLVNKSNNIFHRIGWLLSLCLLSLGAGNLCAGETTDNPDQPGQLSASDYKFAKEAARGGMMEVNLGKIASQKSANPIVQQFGQRMVTDHGKAGDQLKGIATKNGATLPDQLTAVQQKEVDRINSLSGEEFDKEYVALMVHDHKKDLKEFQRAAKTVENPDLKQFAETTSQTVQDHLNMITDIQKQLGTAKTSASAQ